MARKPPPEEYRWKPGQSGNPKGRARGSVNLTQRIRKVLEERSPNGEPWADVLARVLVQEALKNPTKMWLFLKEFMDRDEGRTDGRGESESTETAEDRAEQIRQFLEDTGETIPEHPAGDDEPVDAEVEAIEHDAEG